MALVLSITATFSWHVASSSHIHTRQLRQMRDDGAILFTLQAPTRVLINLPTAGQSAPIRSLLIYLTIPTHRYIASSPMYDVLQDQLLLYENTQADIRHQVRQRLKFKHPRLAWPGLDKRLPNASSDIAPHLPACLELAHI
jgi:hypothetical protein